MDTTGKKTTMKKLNRARVHFGNAGKSTVHHQQNGKGGRGEGEEK
jgi:hypothetical protein